MDARFRATVARLRLVAPTKVPLLIHGESGTGKELFARAAHTLGARPGGPFIAVNCGALPRELAESELFGHERGAFTGAIAHKVGWFGEASGGTLVLDEIGELPLDLQPKLLRVLETGRLRRVGGRGEMLVDVRILAMTNRDLATEARRGRFRHDLYHRLAGFELRLAPLRERQADIPLLVDHFLNQLEPELGRVYVSPAALDRLMVYNWPGNVRELRNVVQRAAILGRPVIDLPALDEALPRQHAYADYAADEDLEGTNPGGGSPAGLGNGSSPPGSDSVRLDGKTFSELEREILIWALRRSGGSRRQAARALGISRSTFCDRVKRLGLAANA